MSATVTTIGKTKKVSTGEMFKAAVVLVEDSLIPYAKGNAARVKTMRCSKLTQLERDLKGVRIGTKNGETEMIKFPDGSTILASIVGHAAVGVPGFNAMQGLRL